MLFLISLMIVRDKVNYYVISLVSGIKFGSAFFIRESKRYRLISSNTLSSGTTMQVTGFTRLDKVKPVILFYSVNTVINKMPILGVFTQNSCMDRIFPANILRFCHRNCSATIPKLCGKRCLSKHC